MSDQMNIEQERAAFEAWGNERFKCGFHPETWDGATEYEHEGTQMAWEAWQASAASRHDQQRTVKVPELPPLPEPVAHVEAFVTRDYGRSTANETLDAYDEYYTADQVTKLLQDYRAEVLRMNGGGG